ncbi:protein unc-13 homolog D-like isoform X2 [Lineus longissimus]|uniref:protein unc-13 homolog D-like isoform X2 n=1 Tax=Lineus longissimus TaxID=88925 RepID=UPI00315D227E
MWVCSREAREFVPIAFHTCSQLPAVHRMEDIPFRPIRCQRDLLHPENRYQTFSPGDINVDKDLIGCSSRKMSTESDKCSIRKSSSLTSSIRRKLSGRKKKTSTASSGSHSSIDDSLSSPVMTSFENLDTKDEATYRSFLRTLVSPLGAHSGYRSGHSHNLADRLHMIYEVDPMTHEGWVKEEEKIKKMNTNTAMLYVRVIEAKALPSLNGHVTTAPYCLLSVVRPHKSNKGTPSSSPRLPIRQKKNSSFELADVKKTKTAKKTSEPMWNEEFEIDVQDLASEVLEVYVSSSEGSTLSLATNSKFHQDPSRLHSMFKHVKHALEHGKSQDCDVLGSVKIPLKEILAVGTTSWYDLTTKHKSNKKGGKIQLQLQLRYSKDAESEQDCHQVLLDQYHSAMAKFHQKAAKKAEVNFNDYDGKLSPEVDLILDYFSVPHEISNVSKQLLKVVCLIQMAIDENDLTVKKDALHEAITNFESAWCSSQLDMPRGGEASGGCPGADLSDHEISLLEEATNNYIRHLARGVEDIPLLFPPSQNYLEQFSNKFDIASRLCNIQTGQDWEPLSKKILVTHVTERIQSDVKEWLGAQLDTVSNISNVRDAVIPQTRQLLKVISEVTEACSPGHGYSQVFSKFDVDFFKIVSLTLDGKLCATTQELMISMDKYQTRYHKIHVNIQQSCTLSLKLYVSLRKIYLQLKQNVTERQVFKLSLTKFYMWFGDALIFWLQMFRKESIRRMEKALEIDKDVVQVTELVKFSNSSVDVLHSFSQIINEWKQIEYVSPDTNLMGVTKLTDTICDGTRIYTAKIRTILEKNGYYDRSNDQFDVTTRLCITLNNIEHVRQFLDDLPRLLQWEDVAEQISIAHEEEEVGRRALITLSELVKDANNDVKMQSCLLLREVTSRMSVDISKYTELYTQTQPEKMNSIDPLLEYFENNLGTVNKKLFDAIMVPMFEELWKTTLQCLEEKLLKGRPTEYYMCMQSRLASLKSYFIRAGVCEEALSTLMYREIIELLQLNAMETEELVLDYYERLSSVENMMTPLDYFGHIFVKLAYMEETRGDVTIYVKIISATDLPGLDLSGLSDPYVKFRLVPSLLFPFSQEQKTEVEYQTLDPEFHQTFHIPNVPKDFLKKKGSAIQFIIMDHDRLTKDDFAGECFVDLSSIKSMNGFQTVDGMPSVMVPLKRPTNATQPKSFWIAQDRSAWDKEAKAFIASRKELIDNQPRRTDKQLPEPKTSIFSKICDALKSAKSKLTLCSEDPTIDDSIDQTDGTSSMESDPLVLKTNVGSRSWRSDRPPTPKLKHQAQSLPVMESVRVKRDEKPRSLSFDNASQRYRKYQPNPFRFPPPSNSLYGRRRTASDVVNPFTFSHATCRPITDTNDNVAPVIPWNQDDAGAWDGYIGGIIPEEQEPIIEQESPRRFSDPGGVPLTPKFRQARQVSDPGITSSSIGSRKTSVESSLTTPTIKEED